MTRTALTLFVLLLIVPVSAPGQELGGGGEKNPALKTNRAALKKWQALRFGMFIHWGPVTLRGTEIGWSRGPGVAIEDYDTLYREFNPALFDAKEWVGAAKTAGIKYLVITSKHHDGFCLWDSKYTDYDIMSTPFHRDVLKELSEECQRQGILFCTYYSVLDWHHPHYTTRYGGDKRPAAGSDMNLYRQYLKNQVAELVRDYHTNLLWFDGEWEESWTHADGMDLYAYARSLNDNLLINNRVDKGRQGMKGMTTSSQFAGDFGTPEQEIGAFDNVRAWESCITIGTQWSWKPNDRMKSPKECIQILAKTAAGGGNLLLNVSPMLDGRIEQRQIERLQAIGRWVERYGESIYGTMGGPFKPTPWLASTCKDNSIYVHLFRVPEAELRLPVIPHRAVTAISVPGGSGLQFRKAGNQLAITLPRDPMDENDAVIEITLDGPASGIAPLDVPENGFKELDDAGLKLTNPPSPVYPGHGARSLSDKIRATDNYYDENWVGFEQGDCEAVVDLRSVKPVSKVTVGSLQNQAAWIFPPRAIDVSVSDDGKTFRPAGKTDVKNLEPDEKVEMQEHAVSCGKTAARFVKVRIISTGLCPPWHKGAGEKAWLFVDEISIH